MSRKTLSLNKHDSTCGILPYLEEKLKKAEHYDFSFFYFLDDENFDYTSTFVQMIQGSRGLYFLDAYDGLKLINVNSELKFYSQGDTLRYLDFYISKHLRRIEAQIKMDNECSYCTKILNSNLYNYDRVERTKMDIYRLARLRYRHFKDLVKKIDFLIGATGTIVELCEFSKMGLIK